MTHDILYIIHETWHIIHGMTFSWWRPARLGREGAELKFCFAKFVPNFTKFYKICTKFVIYAVLSRFQIVVNYAYFFCQIYITKKSGLAKNYFIQLWEGAPASEGIYRWFMTHCICLIQTSKNIERQQVFIVKLLQSLDFLDFLGCLNVINRPGVAGAVLQSTPSLID